MMEGKYRHSPAGQRPGWLHNSAAPRNLAQRSGLRKLGFALSLAACLLVAACGGEAELASSPGIEGKLQVVTTTALLADLVRNVGGDLVEVRSIVPAGADVHSFQTTPQDSIAVSRAQVIVSNGYGLDAFLTPVLQSAKEGAAVHVIVTESIVLGPASGPGLRAGPARTPRPSGDAGQDSLDPHFYQNPENAVVYVDSIAGGLSEADPDNRSSYRANAADYVQRLRALDLEIREILSQVPSARRHLITFHDAFGHFASRYGWKASAFVSGDAEEVSPGSVVRVMNIVRNEKLPAVFVGPQFSSKVIQRSARDAGVSIGTIYSDVAVGGPATYIDIMRSNAKTLAKFLR